MSEPAKTKTFVPKLVSKLKFYKEDQPMPLPEIILVEVVTPEQAP
jgi:hypothetical protein